MTICDQENPKSKIQIIHSYTLNLHVGICVDDNESLLFKGSEEYVAVHLFICFENH